LIGIRTGDGEVIAGEDGDDGKYAYLTTAFSPFAGTTSRIGRAGYAMKGV
jgi:hypothetical protein